MGGRSNASIEEERMNDKQSAQNKAQQQPTQDQTAAPVATNEPAARREASERKPSKIECREWHGSGVCGDRHTD
jgi:hypothetical protein